MSLEKRGIIADISICSAVQWLDAKQLTLCVIIMMISVFFNAVAFNCANTSACNSDVHVLCARTGPS